MTTAFRLGVACLAFAVLCATNACSDDDGGRAAAPDGGGGHDAGGSKDAGGEQDASIAKDGAAPDASEAGLDATGDATTSGAGFGLAQFAQNGAPTSPYSVASNPVFYWKDIEVSEGSHSWSAVDAALDAAAGEGKTAIVRFVANWGGGGSVSPDWYLALPGVKSYIPSGSVALCPVPWDPIYQQKFGAFIAAVGARYDGDPRIELVQIAAGGVYGEMFMGSKTPSDYGAATYAPALAWAIDTYRSAFPTSRLSLMVNALGGTLAEDAATHAVRQGYFLQTNSSPSNAATRAILNAHDHETKIIVEAENGGIGATLPEFSTRMDEMFDLFDEVDYAILHSSSFSDGPTAAYLQDGVIARLRQP